MSIKGEISIGGNWTERHINMLYDLLSPHSADGFLFDENELFNKKISSFEWYPIKDRYFHSILESVLFETQFDSDVDNFRKEMIQNGLSMCYRYIDVGLFDGGGTTIAKFTVMPQAEQIVFGEDCEFLYYYYYFDGDVLDRIDLYDDFKNIDRQLLADGLPDDEDLDEFQILTKDMMADEFQRRLTAAQTEIEKEKGDLP